MKYNIITFGLLVFLSGCGVPERGVRSDVLSRVHANTHAIENGYVRSDSDKVQIWYIGSDSDRHYFGEYRPTKPRLFSDEIVFTFLMKSEIAVQGEQQFLGQLGRSCNLDEIAHYDWKWPVESLQNSEFKGKQVVVVEKSK